MFINDYPLSLYDEDTIFTINDCDDPGRFLNDEKKKNGNILKGICA